MIRVKWHFPLKSLISYYWKIFIHGVNRFNRIMEVLSAKSFTLHWSFTLHYTLRLINIWYKLKVASDLQQNVEGELLLCFSRKNTDHWLQLFVSVKIRILLKYLKFLRYFITMQFIYQSIMPHSGKGLWDINKNPSHSNLSLNEEWISCVMLSAIAD